MLDFVDWMEYEHPEMTESDFGRSMASILASMLGGGAGFAIGGIPGAFGGGILAKNIAASHLPNRGILKVDGTKASMKKKQRKKQRKK